MSEELMEMLAESLNANEFVKYTYIPSKIYDTFSECLDKEIKNIKEDEILFITGSLHFISQVREKYFKK